MDVDGHQREWANFQTMTTEVLIVLVDMIRRPLSWQPVPAGRHCSWQATAQPAIASSFRGLLLNKSFTFQADGTGTRWCSPTWHISRSVISMSMAVVTLSFQMPGHQMRKYRVFLILCDSMFLVLFEIGDAPAFLGNPPLFYIMEPRNVAFFAGRSSSRIHFSVHQISASYLAGFATVSAGSIQISG